MSLLNVILGIISTTVIATDKPVTSLHLTEPVTAVLPNNESILLPSGQVMEHPREATSTIG